MTDKPEFVPREVTIPVTFKEMPPNRILGLRQTWIDADMHDGVSVELACGAGLGNDMLAFTWKDAEGYHSYLAKAGDLFRAFVSEMKLDDDGD